MVVEDHKRTKSGKVVWRCIDTTTWTTRYLRTEQLIKLDRAQAGEVDP